MKRKVLLFIVMCLMVTCFYDIQHKNIAVASEMNTDPGTVTTNASLTNIVIQQNPSKMTYHQGESLNLSDMILQGIYSDGTVNRITDYQVTGYDSNLIGKQSVTISYQTFTTTIIITNLPPKVSNINTTKYSTSSVTLTWDEVPGAIRYEIYSFDSTSSTYTWTAMTSENNITMNYPAATSRSIKICAVFSTAEEEYKGDLSEPFVIATAPEKVTGLNVTVTTATTVTLAWDTVPGATGYIIYRSNSSGKDFKVCKTTTDRSYKDTKLSTGSVYKYKVSAYTYNKSYYGELSSMVDTSTRAKKMVLKVKTGDQKVRVSWEEVTGSSKYDIYIGDDINGYTLATSRNSSYTCKYVIKGLTTGVSYNIYAIARREYKGNAYDSDPSVISKVDITAIAPTSIEAKCFKTKDDLLNSMAYKEIGYVNKYLNYSKSFIIPGLINTNVDGFTSKTMCPQAIAIAGNYLLQTAYDKAGEENSVVYVLDKKSKNLLTTLVLPSKAHVGGIAYDGNNLWITRGTSMVSVQFSQVETAVASGLPYYSITFDTNTEIMVQASFITYYKDKLWVGSYNELLETKMYSYLIQKKDTTTPVLLKADAINLPNRVQGVAFTGDGTMIVSRSCQMYLGLRGYMRQIDIYKPDFEHETKGVISLGDVVNTVEMPSMNEGVIIDGAYVYITFESAAFDLATYQMDRICAFKLSSLLKKELVKTA